MNQFILQQKSSVALQNFPHIMELGVIKNISIRLNAFPKSSIDCIRIYYINDGKFDWTIHNSSYQLYPGDAVLILPGQEFGNKDDVLEIGTFSWINIKTQKKKHAEIAPGSWSGLSTEECTAICNILIANDSPVLSKFPEAGKLLKCIQSELVGNEIGFTARVNYHIDELFILIARQLSRQNNPGRDFPKTFRTLEDALRENLSRQWTVEQMAEIVGMSTTLFNEKVKSYTGFPPIAYLINIRISEAIKLLKKPEISLTDIALGIGFYSSQHFSTTFKKLTGYTPSEFRKNHLPKN